MLQDVRCSSTELTLWDLVPWSSVISLSTLNILALLQFGACHAHEVSRVQHPLVLWTLQAWGCGMPFWPKCCGFDIGDDGGFIIHKCTNSQNPRFHWSRTWWILGPICPFRKFSPTEAVLPQVWGQQLPRSNVTKEVQCNQRVFHEYILVRQGSVVYLSVRSSEAIVIYFSSMWISLRSGLTIHAFSMENLGSTWWPIVCEIAIGKSNLFQFSIFKQEKKTKTHQETVPCPCNSGTWPLMPGCIPVSQHAAWGCFVVSKSNEHGWYHKKSLEYLPS